MKGAFQILCFRSALGLVFAPKTWETDWVGGLSARKAHSLSPLISRLINLLIQNMPRGTLKKRRKNLKKKREENAYNRPFAAFTVVDFCHWHCHCRRPPILSPSLPIRFYQRRCGRRFLSILFHGTWFCFEFSTTEPGLCCVVGKVC